MIMSAIVHEYSHAWMADHLGDPTARDAGRLTLNPLAHIDWFGTLILPLIMYFTTGMAFGYAKPVPYNPYNLKNQKRDSALVALAGPLSNFILALVLALFARFFPVNVFFVKMISIGVYVNVLLMVFNLVPIRPLDGSKIFYALLPDSAWKIKRDLERYGMFLLIFFIMFGFRIIYPIMQSIYMLFVKIIIS